MIIKIADIPNEGLEVAFDVERRTLQPKIINNPQEIEIGVGGEVRGSLALENLTIRILGTAKAPMTFACARCTERADGSVEVPIDLVLKPLSERVPTFERGGDLHFGYYDGQQFDLREVVEEFILLSLPVVPICRVECKGLCAGCGANLNTDGCVCGARAGQDERFAALRGLKI